MKKWILILGVLVMSSNAGASGTVSNKDLAIPCTSVEQDQESQAGKPVLYGADLIETNNAYLSAVELMPLGKRVRVILRGNCAVSYQQFKDNYTGWKKPATGGAPVVVFSDANIQLNAVNHKFTAYNPYTSINTGFNTHWLITVTLDLDEQEWNDFRQAIDAWDGVNLTRDSGSLVIYSRSQ